MTENRELSVQNQDVDASILSGTDMKQWEIVQRVLKQFSKDCTTTVAACKAAGVPHRTYYNAIANPVVQMLRLQQMQGTAAAAQHLIEKNWLHVLGNVAAIARSDDSREAVQAARLLRDVYADLEKGLGPERGRGVGQESDAAKAIRSFLGGKKVLLRQTVTTQEIEVEDDVSVGNYDVIDGDLG